jgi:hypothetical protein
MFRRLRSHHQRISLIQKSFYQIKSSRKIHFNEDLDRKEEFSMRFPWWFLFINYGICFFLILISVFFIIARGIEFGDVKRQQWLISVLSSFLRMWVYDEGVLSHTTSFSTNIPFIFFRSFENNTNLIMNIRTMAWQLIECWCKKIR